MSTLVGTWRLVEWTATIDDQVTQPFGGLVDGLLTYTADGWMWAALQRNDRPTLGTGTLAAATGGQRAAVARHYLSYGGRYTVVDPSTVRHHVEVSLFPDWVGADQVRLIEWMDGDLILASPPEETAGGRMVVNRLRWRRSEG